MVTVLLTGMSGVGKSTVLEHLENNNTLVIDLDYGDWIYCDSPETNPKLDVNKMIKFMKINEDKHIIFAGTAENQKAVYPNIDFVITMIAPIEVMRERLLHRTNNPFGKREHEWQKIKQDKEMFEPAIIRGSDLVIDTDCPVGETIKKIREFTGI